MDRLPLPFALLFVSIANTASIAQDSSRPGLLPGLDLSTAVVAGQWRRVNGELAVSGRHARIALSDSVPDQYSLTLEFTRTSGIGSVGVVLPVKSRTCLLNLSAFDGEAHGIGLIDGALARDNETTIRPGTLENDHPYRLVIEVDQRGDEASISSTLDGRPFLGWSGDANSLSIMEFWRLPSQASIGLYTNGEITFHRAALTRFDPSMRMTRPLSSAVRPVVRRDSIGSSNASMTERPGVTFEGKQWVPAANTRATVESFLGRQALHVVGGEQSFVFVDGSEFGSGTIEVDIASATFSGIGFFGSRDGSLANKLYFRPFNSGTKKHSNTVQYSLLGEPRFGWRTLRESAPGRYESGADIAVNEWFHARIEIDGTRLQAFVDDDPLPVLVVDTMLGDRKGGRVGVWGWDSYFSNFRFTPSGEPEGLTTSKR